MITRYFDLMLYKSGTPPCINVNQYDEGETWVFTLYGQGGLKYTPSTGAIVALKSDGHLIANAGTVDGQGRVVITETQQMTASAGKATCELQIDGETHGTANFYLLVEPSPADGGIPSDSDLSLFQQAVDAAETIEELIEGHDPDDVIADAVDAWLDIHPEATTTVQDGAITAPKINNSLWDKLLVSESASGNPASFDDGADDVPVSSLKVALEPIQTGSGDPSPTNIRPISGQSSVTVERTGKNLYDDTTWGFIGTSRRTWGTGNATLLTLANSLKAGTYTIITSIKVDTLDSNTNNRTIGVYLAGGTTINATVVPYANLRTGGTYSYAQTFTLTEAQEGNFTSCYMYASAASASSDLITITAIGVFKGTVTTDDYEPYQSTSYPYTLGQNVYGGTVDLATGVLTVDRVLNVFDGSATTGWGSVATYGDVHRFDYTNADILNRDSGGGVICNYLPNGVIGTSNLECCNVHASYSSVQIQIKTSRLSGTTVSDLMTYFQMNPLQLCYKLATPTTVQLTPQEVKTLLGYNNISSSGTVEVIYHADTKLYVDKMTAVDNNIIAPTEEGFTATRNYTANDLVIVNDTLYKVTANIASGSAITPNSNVQQTTLSALIKALS